MSVVLAYVPTPEGEAALIQARTEARSRECKIVVVNTSRQDAYVDDRWVQDDAWKALADDLDVSDLPHEMVRGNGHQDTASELLDVAERHSAELLVIGLRRRSAVGKLILGSTAQKVLLQAPCPVLAVKSD
ncbi:universal stress protein [Aeromicrobium sp. CF4.19]|uniref:universal stress protein n=1 Tax=Aeromicrobium sp. CF4.19 TaxID=3373082 RepID=UPI003EE6A91B